MALKNVQKEYTSLEDDSTKATIPTNHDGDSFHNYDVRKMKPLKIT